MNYLTQAGDVLRNHSDKIIDGLGGWGNGFYYAEAKRKEDEIKQGGNYYFASLFQVGQLANLGGTISKINGLFTQNPLKIPVSILCNLAPILSIPGLLYCAAVKQGQHADLAKFFNSTKYAIIKAPEKLGKWTISALSFLSEHTGNMIRVAMIASSVALIALGNVAFGAATLVAIGYEAIDTMGWVPRRISLFMETYMPTVSLIGLVLSSTLIVRVFSAIALSTHILPVFGKYIHQQVDAVARYFFKLQGPSLKEIDAPLVEKKAMTLGEINTIIDISPWEFENFYKINPAHCSTPIMDIEKLPKDNHFEKFLPLFDQINWKTKYGLIKNKLRDDDRFLTFLVEKFPGKEKKELMKICDVNKNPVDNITPCIEELAKQKGISKEEFAANWMREQMVGLVDILQGKKRVKGLQQDLDEALNECSILLPYLTSLKDPIEKEDALLKLAIEGGNYCGRGIKRVTNELIRHIVQKGIQNGPVNPIRDYEIQVLQSLQNERHMIVQNLYQILCKNGQIPAAISGDIHGLDLYRLYFSLGFYPLTPNERKRVGLSEIGVWELYNEYRLKAYVDYTFELHDTIEKIGHTHFSNYLINIINENKQLTATQKEDLIEKWINCNDGQWTKDETIKRFQNLMFVRLGVVKKG